MTDKIKKVTVKSLSEEIVNLKHLHTNEMNFLKDKFAAFEKYVIKFVEEQSQNKEIEVQLFSTEKSDKEDVAKCKLCSLHFKTHGGLRTHMKTLHTKKFTCEMCDETFKVNVDLERHMESHKKPKMFKCEICEKEFHLKWRLQKHMEGHGTITKFCHYFNNGGNCPYDDMGVSFFTLCLHCVGFRKFVQILCVNTGMKMKVMNLAQ
jgi:transcription elongation factor Elf1